MILLCTSPAWGGLEQAVARLARRLRQEDLPVEVLAPAGSPLYEHLQDTGLVKAWGRSRKYFDFSAASHLSRYLQAAGNPPLVISHNYDLDVAAWAHLFSGSSFRLWYWQHMMVGVPKKGIFQRFRQSRLTGWLTPLEYLRQEALEKTTLPPEKIHLVPPGVDVRIFAQNGHSKESYRQIFGLPTQGTVLGLIGRLDPRKGHSFALQALRQINDPKIHLAFMGEATRSEKGMDADYASSLILEADRLGIRKQVHFIPFQENTAPFYHAVDDVLMCTDGETYGMVTIEALAAGTPVIGSGSAGTKDLLGKGAYGFLYEPGDLTDFCLKIRLALANPDLAYHKTEAGRAYLYREADISVTVARFKDLVLGLP